MAVGVPETEVFAAADRVLARGERPTTERVRAELGRGSPARVGQLLEQWWDALSKRLAGESQLPELPAEVAAAFKTVWANAIAHGLLGAEAALAEQQAQLQADRAALEAERTIGQAEIEAAAAQLREADHGRDAAQTRLSDLQRLLDQKTEHGADAVRQRDHLQIRSEQLELELATLRAALHTHDSAAIAEREALATHARDVEDRAHAEVDRAREEAKGLRTRIAQLEGERHAAGQVAVAQLESTTAQIHAAEREAAIQAARAQTLEQQLARMDGLPAMLLAAQQTLRAAHDREAALQAEFARHQLGDTKRPQQRLAKLPLAIDPHEAAMPTGRRTKRPPR